MENLLFGDFFPLYVHFCVLVNLHTIISFIVSPIFRAKRNIIIFYTCIIYTSLKMDYIFDKKTEISVE